MNSGTRWPAEWESQAAVMLAWPPGNMPESEWRPSGERALTRLARLAAECQPVLVVCHSVADRERVIKALNGIRPDRLHLCVAPLNDIWIRDYGPLTVFEQGRPVLLDFHFSGWGGRYPAERDNQVTARLHADGVFGEMELRTQELHMEGGGIDGNGQGYLLARHGWPLAGTRNPRMDHQAFARALRASLNSELLWVRHGCLPGDDTDDHIDMLARFSRGDQIVYAAGDSIPLKEMQRQLWTMCANDMPCELVPLPVPRMTADPPHPASYINFLILNECVLVPQYGDDRSDRQAVATLSSCFPQRDCVGVDAVELWQQGGGPHCAAMQLPEGVAIHAGHAGASELAGSERA